MVSLKERPSVDQLIVNQVFNLLIEGKDPCYLKTFYANSEIPLIAEYIGRLRKSLMSDLRGQMSNELKLLCVSSLAGSFEALQSYRRHPYFLLSRTDHFSISLPEICSRKDSTVALDLVK
ncbi:hypothetical protein HAX54_048029 [Datura stramonium]|uniref:Uncharacterized protein n=1 Tax=Datura stramonium TaxID=4076 RepID=A0ABS8WL94_DATST|nr:hypothetical protein [Datura stramonium]